MEKLETKVVPRKSIRNRKSAPGEEIAEMPSWKTWKRRGLTSPEGTHFESKARAIKHLPRIHFEASGLIFPELTLV